MNIKDRKGVVHIIVFLVAVIIGVVMLVMFRSQGITLRLHTSPAMIGGVTQPSVRR